MEASTDIEKINLCQKLCHLRTNTHACEWEEEKYFLMALNISSRFEYNSIPLVQTA